MAVWQFKFSLVPLEGIERVHGHTILIIEEYRSSNAEKLLSLPLELNQSYSDYWEGIQIGDTTLEAIKAMLPQCESWDKNAVMFGSEEGDRIEIWNDDFNCFFDIRNFSANLLDKLLSIATTLNCKVVLHESGEVIEPIFKEVVERIKESRAYAFCLNPKKFFEDLEKQYGGVNS
ncbi:MAG: hypothetical protein FD167_4489 [bacterium]|nr:MAG: hypothetical protein FD167_4489 [bacterium]